MRKWKFRGNWHIGIETGKMKAAGIGISLADNDYSDSITIHIGLFYWFWLTMGNSWLKRLFAKIPNFDYCWDKTSIEWTADGGRTISIVIWSDHVSWYLGAYKMNGQRRQGCFFFWDWLLGSPKHSAKIIDEQKVDIQLQEGWYHGKWTHTFDTWKRQRWPFPHSIHRAHIELDKPIPIPGKGESAWDIDDDAIYSATIPMAMTYDNQPSYMVTLNNWKQSIEERRIRYGGQNWLPEGRKARQTGKR